MNRKIFVTACIVIVLIQIGYSQEWIKDVMQSNSNVNMSIDSLKLIMKEKNGANAQNIKFKPITNYIFSEKLEEYKDNTVIMMFWTTT